MRKKVGHFPGGEFAGDRGKDCRAATRRRGCRLGRNASSEKGPDRSKKKGRVKRSEKKGQCVLELGKKGKRVG